MIVLKPCPFCGEDDVRCFQKEKSIYEVICFNCECSGPICLSELGAKTKWNARADKQQ